MSKLSVLPLSLIWFWHKACKTPSFSLPQKSLWCLYSYTNKGICRETLTQPFLPRCYRRERGCCPRFAELCTLDKRGYFQAMLGWCCRLGFQQGWRHLFPFHITKHFQHLWMPGCLGERSALAEERKWIRWFSLKGRRLEGIMQDWIQKVNKENVSLL